MMVPQGDAASMQVLTPTDASLELADPQGACGSEAGDGDAIVLPETLDLAAAAPLAAAFAARRGHYTVVNGSRVRRLGAQCAQVIAAAIATWHQDAAPLCIVECSTAMEDDLRTLGLEYSISGRKRP